MRKITELAAKAFAENKHFKRDNTEVFPRAEDYNQTIPCEVFTELRLYGNLIAKKDRNGVVYFSLCGHNTQTTRERLKAAGISVGTRKGAIIWHRSNGVSTVEINSRDIYVDL